MAENRPVGQDEESRDWKRRPDQKGFIAAGATVKPAAPKAQPAPGKPLPPRPTVFRAKVKGW